MAIIVQSNESFRRSFALIAGRELIIIMQPIAAAEQILPIRPYTNRSADQPTEEFISSVSHLPVYDNYGLGHPINLTNYLKETWSKSDCPEILNNYIDTLGTTGTQDRVEKRNHNKQTNKSRTRNNQSKSKEYTHPALAMYNVN